MTETPKFDPVKYKDTTKQQWQAAAEAWHRCGPTLSEWLGPATETMLDMTDVKEGSRVLDIAAGAGEQTIVTAKEKRGQACDLAICGAFISTTRCRPCRL